MNACPTVLPSQFPEAVREQLAAGLRGRDINPKFLYESPLQAAKWLALHEAYSPARTDPACAAAYQAAFQTLAQRCPPAPARISVIGLGCGGGQKDLQLLQLLARRGIRLDYVPVDVSPSLVLTAAGLAARVIPPEHCHPIVCDLALESALDTRLDPDPESAGAPHTRVVALFGMLPNLPPDFLRTRLARLLHPGDLLIFSANLAPGPDYSAAVRRVLPLYDNDLTRDWLFSFLTQLGFAPSDGRLLFEIAIEPGLQLQRIEAWFELTHARTIRLDGEQFPFLPGERIRVFFSYRHTPDLIRKLVRAAFEEGDDEMPARETSAGLEEFITPSGEEGVFIFRTAPSPQSQ